MRERFIYKQCEPSFSEISVVANKLVINFPEHISQSVKGVFKYNTPYKFRGLLNRDKIEDEFSTGNYLDLTLDIPNYPRGIDKPKVFVCDTPENTATTIGRIKYDKESNDFHFISGRYHLGYPALKDMAYAMRASLGIQPLRDSIVASSENPQVTESEMFVIHIAREGPLMRLEGGLFNEYRLNVPYTLVHSRHKEDKNSNNEFGRTAKVCKINFEGLDPKTIKTVAIADNTASGMQHVEVMRKTVDFIKKSNRNLIDSPIQFIIFSPLLTNYGILTTSLFASSIGIKTIYVASSTILECLPPDRYYSPVSNKLKLFVNPQHSFVNQQALGEYAGKICARCNWTASFCAKSAAILSSEQELKNVGTNNEKLLNQSKQLTIERMHELGINPIDYVSYATLEEAQHSGVLNLLLNKLRK